MGACARNMQRDPAEIKPAQCCIKLVFHLTYITNILCNFYDCITVYEFGVMILSVCMYVLCVCMYFSLKNIFFNNILKEINVCKYIRSTYKIQGIQIHTAEIKPAQCCIKLVFHLTYTMMHGSTKLKINRKDSQTGKITCG